MFADVKPNNDSLLYPYLLTVEFSLTHTFGPERETREEAERDTNLEPMFGDLLTSHYRNTFLLGKEGIRIKSREMQSKGLDGSTARWEDRPSWSDACWDHIGATQPSH